MTDEAPHGRPRVKKWFGQHFLTDRNIIRKIVAAAGVKEGDRVLEIGPGTGVLTEELLAAGAFVTAIELDQELIAFLSERFRSGADKLRVVKADALKVDYEAVAKASGGRMKLVANLPYYISGPLLAKLLDERAAFSVMVLMFQKEVALRITAGPGGRDYGNLSVLSQVFTDVKREFDVPAHLFSPRPKVDSSVVSLRVLDVPRVRLVDEAFFRRVVRGGFATRRKTIANSLSTAGFAKDDVAGALAEAGIAPGRRAETFSLDEFAALAMALHERAGRGKTAGTMP